MDSTNWHALVRYKDKEKEEVSISKIKTWNAEGKKVPFRPKDLNDFKTDEWYHVTSAYKSCDGKERKWYALIGKLAGEYYVSHFQSLI